MDSTFRIGHVKSGSTSVLEGSIVLVPRSAWLAVLSVPISRFGALPPPPSGQTRD